MQTDVISTVRNQLNDEMLDRSILQQRGQNVLTAEKQNSLMQLYKKVDLKMVLSCQ